MTTKIKSRSIVVLDLPKTVPDLIKSAQAIVQAMTGNPLYTSTIPPLTTVSAQISTLDSAETATKTRAKGTVEARDEARAALVASLHDLKGCVQRAADAAGDQAASVITGAGMNVRKPTVRHKSDLAAKAGATSGSVELVAKAAAHRASYEWQWSADGGKTWSTAPVTLQAKTTVLGLSPGVVVTFRFRAVTKTGEGDWSQVVSFIVK